MAKKRTVDIDFNALTAKYKKQVTDAQNHTLNATSRMNKANTLLSGAYAKVGSSLASMFGAYQTFNFIGSSVKAAQNAEAAESKLSQAYGKSTTALKEYASAMQKKTTYGDDAIIDGMSILAMYIKDEKAIQDLTKVTLDYAAANKMELQPAFEFVARSFVGASKGLRQYGIETKSAAGSQERLNVLLTEFHSKFQGQAEAAIHTSAGGVKQLTENWDNFQETIGNAVIPALNALIPVLNKAVQGMTNFSSGSNLGVFSDAKLKSFYTQYKQFTPDELTNESSFLTKQVDQAYKKIQVLRKAVDPKLDKQSREGFRIDNLLKDLVLPKQIDQQKLLLQIEQAKFNLLVEQARIVDDLANNRQSVIDRFEPKPTIIPGEGGGKPALKITQGDYSNVSGYGADTSFSTNKEMSGFKSYQTNYDTTIDEYGAKWIEQNLQMELQVDLWNNLASAQENAMKGMIQNWTSAISLFGNANSMLEQFLNTMLQVAAQEVALSLIGSFADGGSGLLGAIGGLFKADGGSVYKGSSYIVGEQGPEIFTPQRSGYIIPNNQINTQTADNKTLGLVANRIGAMNSNMVSLMNTMIKTNLDKVLETEITNRGIYMSNKRGVAHYNKYH